MKSAAATVLALFVALPLACEQPEEDSSSDPIGQGAEDDDDDDDDDDEEPSDEEPGDSQFEDCVDATWAYTELMQSCDGGETTMADVEIVCDLEQRPESVWPRCIEETEAMTACGLEVGCAEWFTPTCWDPYRAMTICFGEPDPGAEPPSGCAWPNDGECDEPEGTNLCPEGTDVDDCAGGTGGGGACDPEYCSGCDTTCDEYACYTCCYSCSGDSCEQTCDF